MNAMPSSSTQARPTTISTKSSRWHGLEEPALGRITLPRFVWLLPWKLANMHLDSRQRPTQSIVFGSRSRLLNRPRRSRQPSFHHEFPLRQLIPRNGYITRYSRSPTSPASTVTYRCDSIPLPPAYKTLPKPHPLLALRADPSYTAQNQIQPKPQKNLAFSDEIHNLSVGWKSEISRNVSPLCSCSAPFGRVRFRHCAGGTCSGTNCPHYPTSGESTSASPFQTPRLISSSSFNLSHTNPTKIPRLISSSSFNLSHTNPTKIPRLISSSSFNLSHTNPTKIPRLISTSSLNSRHFSGEVSSRDYSREISVVAPVESSRLVSTSPVTVEDPCLLSADTSPAVSPAVEQIPVPSPAVLPVPDSPASSPTNPSTPTTAPGPVFSSERSPPSPSPSGSLSDNAPGPGESASDRVHKTGFLLSGLAVLAADFLNWEGRTQPLSKILKRLGKRVRTQPHAQFAPMGTGKVPSVGKRGVFRQAAQGRAPPVPTHIAQPVLGKPEVKSHDVRSAQGSSKPKSQN
ncbi:hypothetical protein ACLOJK_031049 [Asimina triloba]